MYTVEFFTVVALYGMNEELSFSIYLKLTGISIGWGDVSFPDRPFPLLDSDTIFVH